MSSSVINPSKFRFGINSIQFFEKILSSTLIVFPGHAKVKVRGQRKGHKEGIGTAISNCSDNDIGVFLLDRFQCINDAGVADLVT